MSVIPGAYLPGKGCGRPSGPCLEGTRRSTEDGLVRGEYAKLFERCMERLERDDPRRDDLRAIAVLRRTQPAELATVEDRY
jgi:hypothetical protein